MRKPKQRKGDLAGGSKSRKAEHPKPVAPTFEEACAALADVYEFCPEAWTARWFSADERGCPTGRDFMAPEAVSWCAIGGVSAALGQAGERSLDSTRARLKPFAEKLGFDDPATASNTGREMAIKMLRMAAGQLPAVAPRT